MLLDTLKIVKSSFVELPVDEDSDVEELPLAVLEVPYMEQDSIVARRWSCGLLQEPGSTKATQEAGCMRLGP